MARAGKPKALIPYLAVSNAAKALSFYEKAFGARIVNQQTSQDAERIIHAHFKIGTLEFMISDLFDEMKLNKNVPNLNEKRPIIMQWYFETELDLKDFLDQSVEAGCIVVFAFDHMFWGDYYGEIEDPFGYVWGLTTPSKNAKIVKFW